MNDFTANLNLELVDFNVVTWHDQVNQNFEIIDAAIMALAGVGITGVWDNSTAYIEGDRVIDDVTNTMWLCLVGHTSAASGTFSADRSTNPTYWQQITSLPVYRGEWDNEITYFTGDIVYSSDEHLFASAAVDHESAASPDTLRDDIANWIIIVDLLPTVTACELAETNAETAETNAETAETNAELAEANAETAATAAGVSASAASASASAASASEIAAAASEAAAELAETNAETAEANAELAEANAELAEFNAEAALEDFYEAWLGSQASDPSVDLNGDAVSEGQAYWNSTTNELRIYNGSTWGGAATYAEVTRVVTAAGDITMLSTDDVIIVNKTVGAATAVALVSAASRSRPITIIDGAGDAGTNNITINPDGSDTIVGGSSWVIDGAYGMIKLRPITGKWVIG